MVHILLCVCVRACVRVGGWVHMYVCFCFPKVEAFGDDFVSVCDFKNQ